MEELEVLEEELFELEKEGNKLEKVYNWDNSVIWGVHLGDYNKSKEVFVVGCQHGNEYQSVRGVMKFCRNYKGERHIFAIPVVDVKGYPRRMTIFPYREDGNGILYFGRGFDINSLYPSYTEPCRSIFTKALEYKLTLDIHVNLGKWGYGFICLEYFPLQESPLGIGRIVREVVRRKNWRIMEGHALRGVSSENVEDGIIYNYYTPGELSGEVWKRSKYAATFEFQVYSDKPGSRHGRRLRDEEIEEVIAKSLLTYSSISIE